MNSKTVGNITEVETILYFLRKDCIVSQPYGDNARYDLIVDINHKLYKIQCKHGRLENGCITADACNHSKNSKDYRNYTGEVDLFAVYADFTKQLYLIPISEETPKGKFALRIYPPKKKYTKKVWLAEDYLADKIFSKL